MPDLWMDVDTALAEVPVNLLPLVSDSDGKTIQGAVAYNAAGLALRWHFVTTGGAYTVTSVTPTTGGAYDWTDQGDSGVYTIEIPASGGASINNDTEGFGWFTGVATGILPWRGPVIGFRAAGLNNLLIDDAYSTTRGLGGTALPNAAADAAGGLAISDAGGLDLDTKLGYLQAAITSTILGRIDAAISTRAPESGGNIATLLSRIVGTLATGTHSPQSGDAYARIGAGGASLTAIKSVTDKLDTAVELDGAVYRFTTNALEQAPTGGSAPSAADIADAVCDEALSGHTTPGTVGKAIADSGAAADPLASAVPGSYAEGTAGYIIGNGTPADVDEAAIATAVVASIGAGSVTVVAPVSVDGKAIELVQGDDYADADERALVWSSADWPDLTGATVTLNIEAAAGTVTVACTVVTAGAGTQIVRAELDATDTGGLDLGDNRFDVKAVLATSSHVVRLALGTCRVLDAVG